MLAPQHPLVPKLLGALRAEVDSWTPRPPSPSTISQCTRQHWFRVKQVPRTDPPKAETILAADEGWLVEPKVFSLLEAAGYEVGREVECVWDWWPGDPGTPDGWAYNPSTDKPYIVDAKRIGGWSYLYINENGLRSERPDYYDQMQLYMEATHIRRALVVVLCADPFSAQWIWKKIKKHKEPLPTVYVEEYEYVRDRVKELIGRAEMLNDVIERYENADAVPRDYDPHDDKFPCGSFARPYCNWRKACVEAG